MDIAEDESRLIGRARNGDQGAFEVLYRSNVAKIRELVARRPGPDPEVDDLVQVTFTRAFLNLGDFREGSAFSTWLYRIGLNVCSSHLRAKAVRRTYLNHCFPIGAESQVEPRTPERDGPERVLLRKERMRLVRQTIQDLPGRYREPARLRFLQDRTYEEIERELEIPMGTVKCRLWRARARMKEDLRGLGM